MAPRPEPDVGAAARRRWLQPHQRVAHRDRVVRLDRVRQGVGHLQEPRRRVRLPEGRAGRARRVRTGAGASASRRSSAPAPSETPSARVAPTARATVRTSVGEPRSSSNRRRTQGSASRRRPRRSTKTRVPVTALPKGRVSAMLCARPGTNTVVGSPTSGDDVVEAVRSGPSILPARATQGRRTSSADARRTSPGPPAGRPPSTRAARRAPGCPERPAAEEEQRQCGDSGDRRPRGFGELAGSDVRRRRPDRTSRRRRRAPRARGRVEQVEDGDAAGQIHASSVRRRAEGRATRSGAEQRGPPRVEGNERGEPRGTLEPEAG